MCGPIWHVRRKSPRSVRFFLHPYTVWRTQHLFVGFHSQKINSSSKHYGSLTNQTTKRAIKIKHERMKNGEEPSLCRSLCATYHTTWVVVANIALPLFCISFFRSRTNQIKNLSTVAVAKINECPRPEWSEWVEWRVYCTLVCHVYDFTLT